MTEMRRTYNGRGCCLHSNDVRNPHALAIGITRPDCTFLGMMKPANIHSLDALHFEVAVDRILSELRQDNRDIAVPVKPLDSSS
jgi:hypothetical protein